MLLLRGLAAGIFVPVAPVYFIRDEPAGRFVEVAVSEELRILGSVALDDDRRRYAERLTKLRLHQPVFRARVIRAYERQCTICRLRHVELLDAAHIISDTAGGQPVVSNGMAMCKIHHAAYDQEILAVRPDYVVEVRESVLAEVDGPMLRHGLQGIHGWRLSLPKRVADLPDRELLAARYESFRERQTG